MCTGVSISESLHLRHDLSVTRSGSGSGRFQVRFGFRSALGSGLGSGQVRIRVRAQVRFRVRVRVYVGLRFGFGFRSCSGSGLGSGRAQVWVRVQVRFVYESGSVSARGLGFSSGSGSARVARLGLKFSRLTANVTDGRETARAARRWQCGVWGHKWGRRSNTKPNPMRPYGISVTI